MNRDTIYNVPMGATALGIKSGGSTPSFKYGAFLYKVDGKVYTLPLDADVLPPATFVVDPGYQAALTIYADALGALTFDVSEAQVSTEAFDFTKTITNDKNKAVIGFIIVANDSATQWVGGTDDLDATDITATYIDAFGVIGQ